MKDWKEYKVSDIIEEIAMGPFGSNIKRENYVDFGVPYLNGSNLSSYKLNEDSFYYVTEEKAKSLARCVAKRGDIIVTHRGTIGQISYIPYNSKYDKYLTGNSQFRISVNNSLIRPDFLVYYFHTRIGQHKLLSNASQVGVPALARPTSTFKEITIPVPSMETQCRIMDIILSIDDKIECNRRINENLEQQAQALFKSWFVDFEPFKDLPFVESELGMIPQGWKVYKLSDFLPVITGKKDANVANGGDYPFFSCSQTQSWTNGYSFDGSAILVAGNGDFNVKMYTGKFEAYQRTYVLIPYESLYTAWLYYAVKYHLDFITSAARGSVIKFITKGNLTDFMFPAPIQLKETDIIKQFDLIRKNIALNDEESRRLAELRDTLLPRLMSGEIKVEDVTF